MYIQNEKIKNLYRILFMFFCEAGIILQYAIVARIGNVTTLSLYYTMLSNIVCFVYFAYLLVVRPEKENASFKFVIVMCIMITGLGYHFLLNGFMEAGVGAVAEVTFTEYFSNTCLHYIVPIMTFVDYLLFTEKGQLKFKSTIVAPVMPLIYVVFIMIMAQVSNVKFAGFGAGLSRYPYPFLDVDLLGMGKVIIAVAVILFIYYIISCVVYAMDKALGKISNK